MQASTFINYYNALDLTAGATPDLIERKFRALALRYHPDNQATGDRTLFDAIVEAHSTLRDPALRAQYHADNDHLLPPQPAAEAGVDAGAEGGPGDARDEGLEHVSMERDLATQSNILTMLYLRRRRNIREPGIGTVELERLSGCPAEHLEFHLWYLRAKGWVARGDNGMLAITMEGVDRAAAMYRESASRLITDQS